MLPATWSEGKKKEKEKEKECVSPQMNRGPIING
jgi:hypothetical protein